jgi:menaquinone-dependent protoporphyrinogen oxidase
VSRVLVAYASKHGATAEIAEVIADELRRHGLSADCLRAQEVADVEPYDAVVLGSAIYMKRWRRTARRFFSRQRRAPADRPLWVFSSGPCGENPDPSWAEPARVVRRIERLGAREHVVFGGRLPLEPHNFIERSMAKNTAPEHRDLRDWDQIRAWAAKIADELQEEEATPPSRSG